MDVSKIHAFMTSYEKNKKDGRLMPGDRHTLERVRNAKILDRCDVSVLVVATETTGNPVEWESCQGVHDYKTEGGELSILVGGTDADGDHATTKVLVYPTGRWLKFVVDLTTVPNPYYVDPDKPDPDDVAPVGF